MEVIVEPLMTALSCCITFYNKFRAVLKYYLISLTAYSSILDRTKVIIFTSIMYNSGFHFYVSNGLKKTNL